MIVPVDQLGAIGLIADTSTYELPPSAWNYAENVRFLGASIERGPGSALVGNSQSGAKVYQILSAVSGSTHYWVLCRLASLASFNGTTITSRTGATVPSGAASDLWNGGMLNGIAVVNNGVNPPQMWDLPAAATTFADLTGWDSGWQTKVLRPFKNYLVALDVTKSSVRDKRLIKWSHTAAPLTVPTSWDEADPTLDAGEVSLAEGNDALVDCLPLGNANIVYTEDQTWAMSLSGNDQIFNFRLLFPESGLLNQDCAVAFRQGEGQPIRHFCVTKDDFIIHDGSTLTSVGDKRVRNYFFAFLTAATKPYVKVVQSVKNQEIWVFWSTGFAAAADRILAWNYRYNTWSLYNAFGEALGVGTHAVTDEVTTAVEATFYLQTISNTHLTNQGSAIASTLIRNYLPLKGAGANGPVLDPSRKALVTRLWPKISGPSALTFAIGLGVTDDRFNSPAYSYSGNFLMGTNRPLDLVTPPYRYLSYAITQSGSTNFRFDGIEWEISPLGRF